MATALLVITAVGAVAGAVQQRKISKEQRKQNKIQNRLAAISRQRNVKRAIAERRVRTAEFESAGFQLGVGGGTAVQGAVAGTTSDTASAIGASNQQFTGQQAIASIADRISSLQSTAAAFQAVGSVAGQFAGGAGTTGAQNRAAVSDVFGF